MDNIDVVEYIKKSFDLKNQGCYKPAIEMLYKALSIESNNVEILAQLAHLYKLMNNNKRAIYYIEKTLELDKNHIDGLLLLLEIFEQESDFEKAIEICDKISEIQHSSKYLAKKIGILNKLKQFNAIDEIEKMQNNLDEDVLYEIAVANFQNGNIKKAEYLLEKAYLKDNDNQNVLLLLAEIYYGNKEFSKAKRLFTELEKINPTAQVLNFIGLLKLNEMKYQKATEYFLKATNLDKSNHEFLYNLASGYFLQGWVDEAIKYFISAVSLAPQKIDYHYSLAYSYFQKTAYDKALLELDLINSIDANHEFSKVLKALISAKKGDLLGAKSKLEEIINSSPDDDFALASLSKVYKELSQIVLSKKMIERALIINPNSLDYLSDLVDIEFILKNFEKALELSEKIIEINPKYVQGFIAQAKIYYEQKDFQNAFESAQSIIDLDTNSPEGYYYNALSLFELGDINFAIESLKKSISLDLNNAALYVKMSEFYQELGNFELALQWAKEAVDVDDKSYQNKWLCAKLALVLKNEKDAMKYYSLSYRLAPYDKDLVLDYTSYLSSQGKEKQAKSILKTFEKSKLINKNLSLK